MINWTGLVSDPNDDDLSYSVETGPHLSYSSTGYGRGRITPDTDWYGSSEIMLTVSDGEFVVIDYLMITVMAPPILNIPESFSFSRNDSLQVNFRYYIESDSDDLSISFSGNSAIQISQNGLQAVFSAPDGFVGSETITAFVSDLYATVQVDFSVNVINHAPVLNLPDSISMDMNGYLLLDFTAYISDPDGDVTTLGVSGNSNVTVSIQGYEVSFSPNSDWYGEETITFTLSDGNLETSDDVLMIVNYVVYELDVPEPMIMADMNGISISWQAISDAQEYHVYRSSSPDGPFELIEVTNNTFYLESTIEDKAFYYIKAAVPAISVKQ